MQCEYSRGRGTGVAEAIGNWGFCSRMGKCGNELSRIRCLFNKMDCMRTAKPIPCVKYNPMYDPEAWQTIPSPDECKPPWTFPMRRPLIVYNSTADIIKTSNLTEIGADLYYPIPGRSYVLQGTNKWYRCDACCSPPCLPLCMTPCPPKSCCY